MAKKSESDKAEKKLLKAIKKELKKQRKQGADYGLLDQGRSKQLAYQFVSGLIEEQNPPRHTFPHHGIVLTKPWKGKPCKNCPALDGHLCKCALKQTKKARLRKEV